jgi:ABC-type uncharacterized transport system permease subunit
MVMALGGINAGKHKQEELMSTGVDETTESLIAFVSGALLGAAATLLYIRMQRNKLHGANPGEEDYCYDGGDLFI